MRYRHLAMACAVLIALTGCAGGSSGPTVDGSVEPDPAPTTSADATTSSAGAPVTLEYDQATVDALIAQGLNAPEALFAAMTTTTVERLDAHVYRVTQTFPTANTAAYTVTVIPDQVGDPDVVELTSSQSAEGFAFTLRYFIPYDAMPDELQQPLRSGSIGAATVILAVAGGLRSEGRRVAAAAKDGATVVVEALVKQFTNAGTKSFLSFLEGKLGPTYELNNLVKSLKTLMSVKDSIAMEAEFSELDSQLDKLQDCVENPTNPVTKNAYRDDPGLRQRLLDQVAATRSEVKANTAVMFLGLLNSVGAGLTKVPWLGWVMGPGTAWSKATLQDMNARLIKDLKKNIVSCDGFKLDFTARDMSLRTLGIGTDHTADIVGHVSGCPGESGQWIIDGTAQMTNSAGGANPRLFILDLGGGRPPDRLDLVISDAPTVELHRQLWPAGVPVNKLTIEDPLGDPTATVTLYNALSEHIGDFRADVVSVPPDCQ